MFFLKKTLQNQHFIDDITRNIIEDVKNYLCDGFYYSYGYDLTCSRQRRIKWLQNKRSDPLELIAADKRYFWNLSLYREFLA